MPNLYFDEYIRRVRDRMDDIYQYFAPHFNPRSVYYAQGVRLIEALTTGSSWNNARAPSNMDSPRTLRVSDMDTFATASAPMMGTGRNNNKHGNGNVGMDMDMDASYGMPMLPGRAVSFEGLDVEASLDPIQFLRTPEGTASYGDPDSCLNTVSATTAATPEINTAGSDNTTQSMDSCEICGYRPKGDPRWFGGSMAKHKKLQHAEGPPTIYRCTYPGCRSQYKNRPDNLRQHQIDKGHFVDGDDSSRRAKRRKMSDDDVA